MLQAQGSNGFQMSFENGWTISVQWGYGNYCDNYNNQDANKYSKEHNNFPSNTAEIAAWDKNNQWHKFEESGDTVLGHVTSDAVAKFITMIAAK